jgi:beta-glucosidase
MGRAFVGAFERMGVITTPKHFVANVGDGGRDSYPIDWSRRFLEEYHFPPFRSVIRQAGARSVMTAYNSVDGAPATQNRTLLTEILKGEWGFDGFVISDAAATGGATVLHMTEASTAAAAKHALEAGLDVIFQSTWEQHRPYLDAFRRGLIADSVIDAAVRRVLRAKIELGLFDDPYVDPDSAAYWNRHPDHLALAREAAIASRLAAGEDYVETSREYDAYGRLREVTEPSGYNGNDVSTTYAYDVGSRLTEILTTAFVDQARRFSYDNRGFLAWEQHPEKGTAGNGKVFNYDIDSSGLVHRTLDGPNDLAYDYDFMGRLTAVKDRNDGNNLLTQLT